jgi:regulation of enolase protein 1 (concanavalin A-like superfamily)
VKEGAVAAFLHETFVGPGLDPRLAWLNEPPVWAVDPAGRCLRVHPAAGTDFWQRTHYGFRADSGHLLAAAVEGDWVLSAHVAAAPVHQYDQAGLMARLSPDCWLKTSVEHEPGRAGRLGAVVTNGGYSDWSTQDFTPGPAGLWLRVRREGADYLVEWSADGAGWVQLRVARLHDDPGGAAVACGLYACSPKGAGFAAEFRDLRVDSGRVA